MNSKMKSAKKASPLAVIIFAVAWILVGCGGSSPATQTVVATTPATTSAQHKLTATDLAHQYHGHKIIIENVGPTPNADGLLSQTHFMYHGMLYQADVFQTHHEKVVYFKRLKLYGFSPRWQGALWGVWPVKSHG